MKQPKLPCTIKNKTKQQDGKSFSSIGIVQYYKGSWLAAISKTQGKFHDTHFQLMDVKILQIRWFFTL